MVLLATFLQKWTEIIKMLTFFYYVPFKVRCVSCDVALDISVFIRLQHERCLISCLHDTNEKITITTHVYLGNQNT